MSEDQLQPEDTLDDRGVDDILDEGISPPERRPRGVTESKDLDDRLGQEEPEVWEVAEQEADADILDGPVAGEVGDRRTGRLMAQSADDDRFAEDEGIDGAGASAEEAAVHTIEE